MPIRSYVKNLIDLTMPQSCAGCGRPHVEVCARCAATLASTPHRVDVRGMGRGSYPIMATTSYEGAAKSILIAAKERNQVALIPIIAKAAFFATSSLLGRAPSLAPVVLVPVPSMPKNIRMRGYNLVAQMANLVAVQLRMSIGDVQVLPVLKHARRVIDQSRLTAQQRAVNLRGAFTIDENHASVIAHRQVIIIDDLVTTGSTLLEARRALSAVGADVLGAACAMSSR